MELTPQPIEYSLLFANARLDFSFCLKLWRDGAFLVSISRLFHRHIPSGRKDFLKDCSLVLGLIYAVYMPYTVKLGYIKLGFYEYMVYIEVLSRPERNPIDFHAK